MAEPMMFAVPAKRAASAAGVGLAALLVMIAVAANGQMDTMGKGETIADASGNLHVPDSYRSTYEYLGSWAVAVDQGQGSKEFHTVYASPGTAASYRNEGKFPDGSILVKEVFQAATGQMTTGTVSHAETLKGWFVMVKGGGDRYPGNKLWGDGWGWSWFDASNPSKTTSTDYRANCLGCHVPAQATDWVYVRLPTTEMRKSKSAKWNGRSGDVT